MAVLISMITLPLVAQDPATKPDDSWISISGIVENPTATGFQLDYGDGIIWVEMDDFDYYPETSGMIAGDAATVFGRIDDDWFEHRTIEAGSVYNQDLNSYFFANPADEEEFTRYWTHTTPVVVSQATFRGTVTSVDPASESFTIYNGVRTIEVETEDLGYNPLDDEGFQQIDIGDRVTASGEMTNDFFEGRALRADRVLTLTG